MTHSIQKGSGIFNVVDQCKKINQLYWTFKILQNTDIRALYSQSIKNPKIMSTNKTRNSSRPSRYFCWWIWNSDLVSQTFRLVLQSIYLLKPLVQLEKKRWSATLKNPIAAIFHGEKENNNINYFGVRVSMCALIN